MDIHLADPLQRRLHARWVVDWRACVDPDADNVELDSSHAGMSVHPRIYKLLGEQLAALSARAPSEQAATR